MGTLVQIGREEWLRSLGIVLMILVRVVLVNMRVQVPLMLQAKILEMIVVIVVMMVMIWRISRKILKKSQIGLKPKNKV